MTDDEILQLVDTECPSREYVRIMTNQDLIDFAEAVVHRTLTNQKARWYLMGAEDERRACAAICDAEMEENAWESNASVVLNNVAAEIRARGE